MPTFRFRAQPALELRRREHEAAQRALARVDAERQHTDVRLSSAEHTLGAARKESDEASTRPELQPKLEWYRFWIVKLEQERVALRAALDACETAVAEARAACLAARQRYEALDRLREKAYSAYVAEEAAADRKQIDELAVRQFIAQRRADQGA